jgi:adenylylsulfate kinase
MNLKTGTDTVWYESIVNRKRRETMNGHRSAVIWFTGLSGSGKSTLAHAVEEELYQRGCRTFVLDGDNVRQGLCSNLGFSVEDRSENIRRVAETAKLMVEAGSIVMTAIISPFRVDRERARNIFSPENFIEIYCAASLEICEKRDVKGLYARAKAGEIKNFTGISSPYEPPLQPDLCLNTGKQTLDECVENVLSLPKIRSLIE